MGRAWTCGIRRSPRGQGPLLNAGEEAGGQQRGDREQELGREEGQARGGPSPCSHLSAWSSKESENSTSEPQYKYMEVYLARNVFYLS